MAEKKKTTKSKTTEPKAAAKKTTATKAKKTADNTKKREASGEMSIAYQLKLIIFTAVSTLCLLSVFGLPLGSLGPYIRGIFTGLFSHSGLALPAFFISYAAIAFVEKLKNRKTLYFIALCLLFAALNLLMALLFSYTSEADYGFSTALDFYERGKLLRGGGLLGSMLFYPLNYIIGSFGITVLIIANIAASLTMITGLNFTRLVKLFGRGLKYSGEKAIDGGKKVGEVLERTFDYMDERAAEREYLEEMREQEHRENRYAEEDEEYREEHLLDFFFKPKKRKFIGDISENKDFKFIKRDENGEIIREEIEKPEKEYKGFKFIDIPKDKKEDSLREDNLSSFTFTDWASMEEEADDELNSPKRTDETELKIENSYTPKAEKFEAEEIIAEKKHEDKAAESSHSINTVNKDKDMREELPSVENADTDCDNPDIEEVDANNLPNSNYYELPPIDMLKKGESTNDTGSLQDMKAKAAILTETFKSFKVDCEVVSAERGPMITRFEVKPMPGVKISKIAQLNDDIALKLAATQVRILAPIPGKAAVGIEVPNETVSVVRLRDVLESKEYAEGSSLIRFGLGKDISGKDIVPDLAKMPHLLIAGATGSGKSVCVNTVIASILFNSKPDEVKFLMIDPKVVELGIYNGIAHLLLPVVTDANKASIALNWAVNEMTRRYNLFANTKCKDITSYNQKIDDGLIEDGEPMPRIVIIIDELADLMMVAQKQVEDSIARIAQMARAAGMHLIVATQRPSVDVITGVIKANIPSRIAFAVSSHIDSRTIIDEQGAEKLLGKGDMLFLNAGKSKPTRVQGSFISDNEIEALVNYIKAEAAGEPVYDDSVVDASNMAGSVEEADMESDSLLSPAISFVIASGKCSTSMIQRKFKIGYNRAARIVEEMEERGIVGAANGAKPREILNSAYSAAASDYSSDEMEG